MITEDDLMRAIKQHNYESLELYVWHRKIKPVAYFRAVHWVVKNRLYDIFAILVGGVTRKHIMTATISHLLYNNLIEYMELLVGKNRTILFNEAIAGGYFHIVKQMMAEGYGIRNVKSGTIARALNKGYFRTARLINRHYKRIY